MKFTKILSLRLSVYFILLIPSIAPLYSQHSTNIIVSGKIFSTEQGVIDYATVYLKGTNHGSSTNQSGQYKFNAPTGQYTLVVSAIGYQTVERNIQLSQQNENIQLDIKLSPQVETLSEVTVESNGISRLQRSAYNAVGIDTKALQNSTQSLSDALTRAPGLKVRESGGVGSDMHLMMDGFSGKHIKIFIDGVPQEGVGSSFGLNNIPANYAERIEVYRGVVPVGFGTDAIGGVINVVTKKIPQKKFIDASYSYGSFNTHKSYVNFGQTFENGLTYEVNAFQNYSDNNYYINTPVEIFNEDGKTSVINEKKIERVKRFHDNFHNEAISGKVGIVGKEWADRLIFGFTYSQMYKEIQNGVKQEIVYGGKYRKGHSIMPSLEYNKRNLLKGLDILLTANYNKNISNNVDTTLLQYNWYGESRPRPNKMPGEQKYQDIRSDNNNWNGTFTANYHIGESHTFTLNHVTNSFSRTNEDLLGGGSGKNPIKKETKKNISGLSYRLMPNEDWNISVFGKYYNQFIAGPIAVNSNQTEFIRTTNSVSSTGYGVAGTYYILKSLQTKLSYEKTYRLPTNDEMFGDEDLETGNISIKPENSNNFNFNLSYNNTMGEHSIYLEGGIVYRDTKDFIQRKLQGLSGGKMSAGYENHAKVETKGFNLSVRYGFSKWISLGGSFSQVNARSNVKTTSSTSNQENVRYGARMPNTPYQFANSDVSFYWPKLGRKDNMLTVTYDNLYLHSFPLYAENIGSKDSKQEVPSQFSHNITISYGIQKGRYNLSFECKNFTDEKTYDNFSLQKAGRAFYGKVRVYFGK